MYIPPGFTVVTCELVSEESLRAWAEGNGGIWQPEGNNPYRRAQITWDFSGGCEIAAYLCTPSEKQPAEWTPQMHKPPQSIIGVEVEDGPSSDEEQWTPLIWALFAQWDSYAYDFGTHEWVSVLLRAILPAERIIRYEPLPLSAGPAWIWVSGKYTRNEAYHDNCDADETCDKNQL